MPKKDTELIEIAVTKLTEDKLSELTDINERIVIALEKEQEYQTMGAAVETARDEVIELQKALTEDQGKVALQTKENSRTTASLHEVHLSQQKKDLELAKREENVVIREGNVITIESQLIAREETVSKNAGILVEAQKKLAEDTRLLKNREKTFEERKAKFLAIEKARSGQA